MKKIHSILHFLPVLLTPLLLASCLKEEAVGPSGQANRTVLYYLQDDRLSAADIQEKVEALTAAWTTDADSHLLVFQEAMNGTAHSLIRIHGDGMGKGFAEVVKTYENKNVQPQTVFARALSDVTTLYPASSYGLVLCSRSSGWLPDDTEAVPRRAVGTSRSIIADETQGLELSGFASAIPDGQFTFILFEGSHMAGVEVAYELKEKTEYILASAAEMPPAGFTPVSGKLIAALYGKTPRLEQFATDYYEYRNSLEGDERWATVSVIRTSELAPLKALLGKVESRVEHWEYVDRTEFQHFDRRRQNYLFYDLADYVQGTGTDEENRQLAEILAKAVVYEVSTESLLPGKEYGFGIERHCGLTIYVPVAQFAYLNTQRGKLKLFGG